MPSQTVHRPAEATDGRARRRLENGARIFDAAMDLLADRSYDEISVDEICAAANVGRATFFRIYRTKAELLLEFNKRLAERVRQRLDAGDPRSIDDALRMVGEEIAETWAQSGPGAAALAIDFTQTAGGRSLHAAHPELLRIVVRIIETALASGELQTALPADLLASLALVQVTAPVGYWFRHPELNLHQLINQAIEQWLHGAKTQ